jgi:hypothetical protein
LVHPEILDIACKERKSSSAQLTISVITGVLVAVSAKMEIRYCKIVMYCHPQGSKP